jgi:hypothetical protein
MTIKSGITADTPDRIIIDAGAVYLNYGLTNQRLLGATRGGNEFNLNRVTKNIEADGLKGAVKGMKRVTEVNPQITANLIELSVENLIAAIAGADQLDYGYIESEYLGVGGGTPPADKEFPLSKNNVVENSERVYWSPAAAGGVLTLKTRSEKYDSRFVGTNAAENKEFETGTGDWEKDAGTIGDLDYVAGGFKGKCMKYVGSAASDTTFILTLDGKNGAVLTNLVKDQHYRFQFAMKKGTTYETAAVITPACTNAPDPLVAVGIAPAADWTVYVYEFKATATGNATLTLTGDTFLLSGDEIYFDFFELEQVDGDYVMKWEGGDATAAKASVIFSEGALPADTNHIIVSYTYLLGDLGDHTTIKVEREIALSDYITNVAIVGNVSGKTKPVICIVKNALADAGFSLATAPRDEAVPAIVFTGHYDPSYLDKEPWEIRWPNA